MPLRILHISTRLILGGSQENTVLSCEGQAAIGHDVHLAFGPIYGPEGSLLERVQKFRTPDGRGIATHVVPHLVRELNPWADWRCYSELRRLIEQVQPDVVHTHSSKAGILGRAAGWTAIGMTSKSHRKSIDAEPRGDWKDVHGDWNWMRSGRGLRPAVIHTIHGPPFMPVEGGPVRRSRVRLKNHGYTLAERYAAKRCHTIVSVADAMTTQFLARGIGRPDQYTTVYSGMETDRYLTPAPGESRQDIRASLGLSPQDFVIGTVARLAEHKGHDDLLDALAEDLKKNPNWKLLWVGDGWWRKRLLTKARALGLTIRELDRESPSPPHLLTSTPPHAQLLLTGLVPSSRVPALIRAMDVLAHPSYREGLPRTVPQALLCGVCPVAYDVDGTAEVICDGQTGRLVAPGDLPGLRVAIEQLAANPAARSAMATRGRDECRDRFSAQRMVADLETVYQRALSLATQPPPRP